MYEGSTHRSSSQPTSPRSCSADQPATRPSTSISRASPRATATPGKSPAATEPSTQARSWPQCAFAATVISRSRPTSRGSPLRHLIGEQPWTAELGRFGLGRLHGRAARKRERPRLDLRAALRLLLGLRRRLGLGREDCVFALTREQPLELI